MDRKIFPNDAEKQKIVEATINQINKDFGKGTMQILGDSKPQKLPRVSSGSYYIDEVLGGGYPKGRIVEIYGPESSGKCLTKDTQILTRNGYKTVEEIFIECGLGIFTVTKDVYMQYELVNKDGDFEKTVAFTYNGKKPVYKVRTRTGNEIKATAKHPLLVMDENGYLTWRYTGNLQKGDYLVARRNDRVSSGEKKISNEEAYLLGLLVANGHFGEGRILFTNDDDDIKAFFENKIHMVEELENIDLKSYPNGDSLNSFNYHINAKESIKDFYNRVGIESGVAKNKAVPSIIKESSIETQEYFLRGYFDCECSIDVKTKTIEAISASKRLLLEIKLMLMNIGIVSFLTTKKVSDYENNEYWRLSIYGKDVHYFAENIGFLSSKRIRTIRSINQNIGSSNHDCIPNIQGMCDSFYKSIDPIQRDSRLSSKIDDLKRAQCSRDTLGLLLKVDGGNQSLRKTLGGYLNDKKLYFDRVEEVESIGSEPTFDFAMERTHTFIAESIINHNTTVALHAIAELQSQGEMAVFIDAENALDVNYAQDLGVNVKDLLLTQPGTAEEALEIAERWIRSDVCGIVVIDSVAALVPKAEMEGNIGDNHVGLTARLMSQALRKLAGIAQKSGTIVIFINQIREKVGVMFGNQLKVA